MHVLCRAVRFLSLKKKRKKCKSRCPFNHTVRFSFSFIIMLTIWRYSDNISEADFIKDYKVILHIFPWILLFKKSFYKDNITVNPLKWLCPFQHIHKCQLKHCPSFEYSWLLCSSFSYIFKMGFSIQLNGQCAVKAWANMIEGRA